MITQESLKEFLEYDKETGVFTWKCRGNNSKYGKIAGSLNNHGYIMIMINGKNYAAHRLAFLYVEGEFPTLEVDHINTNKSFNGFSNLRKVTRSQNQQNVINAQSNNKSTGILGVSYNKRRCNYVARIMVDKKSKYLGAFKDLELAKNAYTKAKKELHIKQLVI